MQRRLIGIASAMIRHREVFPLAHSWSRLLIAAVPGLPSRTQCGWASGLKLKSATFINSFDKLTEQLIPVNRHAKSDRASVTMAEVPAHVSRYI